MVPKGGDLNLIIIIIFSLTEPELKVTAEPELNEKNVLSILAGLSPKNTVNLALKLGLKMTDYEKIEYNHPKDMNRVQIEVIQLWRQNITKPKPSWAVLKEALLQVQPDLVEKIPTVSED